MPTIKEAAAAFLANERIAVTGVSRSPKEHGANTVETGPGTLRHQFGDAAHHRRLARLPEPQAIERGQRNGVLHEQRAVWHRQRLVEAEHREIAFGPKTAAAGRAQ